MPVAQQNQVLDLIDMLASGEIAVFEFMQVAEEFFSDQDLAQLRNISRAFGAD